MKGIRFSPEEQQLLVEALLFTACTDVCSEHTDEHRQKMLELVDRLNDDNKMLENIYIYDVIDDKHTEKVIKTVKNISVKSLSFE